MFCSGDISTLSAIHTLQKIYFNTPKDSTRTGYLGHLYYCSEASVISSDTPSRFVICQEWCFLSVNSGKSINAGLIWLEQASRLETERANANLHCKSKCPILWMVSHDFCSFSSPCFQDHLLTDIRKETCTEVCTCWWKYLFMNATEWIMKQRKLNMLDS